MLSLFVICLLKNPLPFQARHIHLPRKLPLIIKKNNSQKTVTLLPGWMQSRENFRGLINALSRSGYKVILPEFRGSGTQSANASFSIKELADDIQNLWARNSITESSIIAFSMGGLVAQDLLKRHTTPHISKALLLSTSSNLKETQRSEPIHNPYFIQTCVAKTFATAKPRQVSRLQESINQLLSQPHNAQSAFWQRQAIQKWTPPSATPESKDTEVHVLHGQKDQIFSIISGHKLAKNWKANLHIFPHCGHLLFLEDPKALTQKVLSILDDNSTPVSKYSSKQNNI